MQTLDHCDYLEQQYILAWHQVGLVLCHHLSLSLVLQSDDLVQVNARDHTKDYGRQAKVVGEEECQQGGQKHAIFSGKQLKEESIRGY